MFLKPRTTPLKVVPFCSSRKFQDRASLRQLPDTSIAVTTGLGAAVGGAVGGGVGGGSHLTPAGFSAAQPPPDPPHPPSSSARASAPANASFLRIAFMSSSCRRGRTALVSARRAYCRRDAGGGRAARVAGNHAQGRDFAANAQAWKARAPADRCPPTARRPRSDWALQWPRSGPLAPGGSVT